MILALPTPLPAKLFIQCENETEGYWEVINTGSRIKLPQVSRRIELRTIDGKRYELLADFDPNPPADQSAKPEKIYLTYVSEDKELADKISGELEQHNIKVTLLQESPGETTAAGQDDRSETLAVMDPCRTIAMGKSGIG